MKIETTVGMVVIVALIFSLGIFVLANIQETTTAGTPEYNVTAKGITAFNKFSTLLLPLVLIVVVALVLWAVNIITKSASLSAV